jgi:SAM-dependent methyltransferase
MKQALRIKTQIQKAWLSRPDTQRLMALEGGWLSEWVGQLHGRHLLYAGVDQDPKFLNCTPTQHCFRVGLPWQKDLVDVQAHIQDADWPFADESIDVTVLQHALDMTNRPHQLIREATRSLVSGGYLIVVGFNPASLWGGVRWLRTLSTELPWVANPVAHSRLSDWLMLLDFRIESLTTAAHIWPLNVGSESLSRRIDRVVAGNTLIPGNTYILVARKTVAGMTTIRPRKRIMPEPRLGFAMPAAREPMTRLDAQLDTPSVD